MKIQNIVTTDPPASWRRLLRQVYRWGSTDNEAKLRHLLKPKAISQSGYFCDVSIIVVVMLFLGNCALHRLTGYFADRRARTKIQTTVILLCMHRGLIKQNHY